MKKEGMFKNREKRCEMCQKAFLGNILKFYCKECRIKRKFTYQPIKKKEDEKN